MTRLIIYISGLLVSTFFLACSSPGSKTPMVDEHATAETKALFHNLAKLSENHTLFGHQSATEYGHGWIGDPDRSDVKSVCGSHPAVIGVDLLDFSGRSEALIQKSMESLRKNVVATYERGGVTTASWHFSNPVSEDGFYWNDSVSIPAVKYIIPGGEAHGKYKEILQRVAAWAHSLEASDGTLAPVIFRPYHEFEGGWFWWGAPHCTVEEFVSLWKFTVSYLRDSMEVHNFIYAFSPDNKFENEAEFLGRYPGDEWVDLLGVDNYGDLGRDQEVDMETAARKLKIVADYAEKAGKLAAFTETGLESIPDPTWWTQSLLPTMRMHNLKLAYVLVWRNDTVSPTHYYAPFPGQVSVPNFLEFYKDPYTLFENDLEGIYEVK